MLKGVSHVKSDFFVTAALALCLTPLNAICQQSNNSTQQSRQLQLRARPIGIRI